MEFFSYLNTQRAFGDTASKRCSFLIKKEEGIMSNRTVYQLSARQILLLAIASALIAVGVTALLYNVGKLWPGGDPSTRTFAEAQPPTGISDPTTVSDEQNNIEVYKVVAPGVA